MKRGEKTRRSRPSRSLPTPPDPHQIYALLALLLVVAVREMQSDAGDGAAREHLRHDRLRLARAESVQSLFATFEGRLRSLEGPSEFLLLIGCVHRCLRRLGHSGSTRSSSCHVSIQF